MAATRRRNPGTSMNAIVRLAAVSAIALCGFTAMAAAAEMTASTNTAANLRTGPGTTYAVITSLDEGTDVMVHACTFSWCAVTTEDDDDGFVARVLLDFEGDGNGDGDVTITLPTPAPPVHLHGGGDGDVCFYQQANFMGANFCVQPGDEDAHIPGSFNNNIESVLIEGNAVAELCDNPGYSGCLTFDRSIKKLPPILRNKVSSYSISTNDGSFTIDQYDDSGDDFGVITLH